MKVKCRWTWVQMSSLSVKYILMVKVWSGLFVLHSGWMLDVMSSQRPLCWNHCSFTVRLLSIINNQSVLCVSHSPELWLRVGAVSGGSASRPASADQSAAGGLWTSSLSGPHWWGGRWVTHCYHSNMKTDAQSAAGQPVQSQHHWYTSLIEQTSVETGRTASRQSITQWRNIQMFWWAPGFSLTFFKH